MELIRITGDESLVRQAYEKGQNYREALKMRVSPFYSETVRIRGKRIDIAPMLDAFFFAGYDGEPYPERNAVDPKGN